MRNNQSSSAPGGEAFANPFERTGAGFDGVAQLRLEYVAERLRSLNSRQWGIANLTVGDLLCPEESQQIQILAFNYFRPKALLMIQHHVELPCRDVHYKADSCKIAAIAGASLGRQLWRNHADAVQWGNLGCAASVSTVLRDAGIAGVDEIGVLALSHRLTGQGWQRHSFANRRAGDVIIALADGHAHTGVVGLQRNITYNNHSSSGKWSKDVANHWESGKWSTIYVLRAPQALVASNNFH